MSDITLIKVYDPEDRTLPVFAAVERLMQDIGRRARELSTLRGYAEGHALDDWLQAEHEYCWPAAELIEGEGAYVLSVTLPGYAPEEIEVTVTPRELVVHACQRVRDAADAGWERDAIVLWSDFRANDVYRRFELPAAIEVELAVAALQNGLLKVTLPKAVPAAGEVPIAAAA